MSTECKLNPFQTAVAIAFIVTSTKETPKSNVDKSDWISFDLTCLYIDATNR